VAVNLGEALPEDGVNDAETCSSDIRVYLCISKSAAVGVGNGLLTCYSLVYWLKN